MENKQIFSAILAAQKQIKSLKKDEVNPHFKSGYVSLNALREHVLPILQEQGLIVLQPTEVLDSGQLVVRTRIIHAESQQEISSVTPVIAKDFSDAQKVGSGISYARRYALQSILFLSAEDDDGNEASFNKGGGGNVNTNKTYGSFKKTFNTQKQEEL